ncbi:MAG: MlaD family protein [Opitutales bacterium]
MSQAAHHARIGIFVLVGLFLVAATTIYVGSVRLFGNEATVLFYFSESVNGLSVGSPVKFKGVPIGEVSRILISYDQDASMEEAFIPVFAKIDQSRIRSDLGVDPALDFQDQDQFDAQLLGGLRAKLEMESFITGQLYVEMDYFARPGDELRIVQQHLQYLEIPTVPSTMAELGSSASSIMAKLASLDVNGLSDTIRETVTTLNEKISALDTAAWNTSVIGLTEELREISASFDAAPLIAELRDTNRTLQSLAEKVEGSIDPALESYQAVITEARGTLAAAQTTFRHLDGILEDNGDLGDRLDDTLLEAREAARALRELLEFIERNPRALLSGRETP